MNDRAPIRYRGFWDVPRIFLTQYRSQNFLFDCAFDEELDDYPEAYKVYSMPEIRDDELPKDWSLLLEKTTHYFGEVPVSRVQFDATRRASIDMGILDEILHRTPITK
jgi:hypothetical protein